MNDVGTIGSTCALNGPWANCATSSLAPSLGETRTTRLKATALGLTEPFSKGSRSYFPNLAFRLESAFRNAAGSCAEPPVGHEKTTMMEPSLRSSMSAVSSMLFRTSCNSSRSFFSSAGSFGNGS